MTYKEAMRSTFHVNSVPIIPGRPFKELETGVKKNGFFFRRGDCPAIPSENILFGIYLTGSLHACSLTL